MITDTNNNKKLLNIGIESILKVEGAHAGKRWTLRELRIHIFLKSGGTCPLYPQPSISMFSTNTNRGNLSQYPSAAEANFNQIPCQKHLVSWKNNSYLTVSLITLVS